MENHGQLQSWRKRMLRLQLGQDILPELGVLIKQTVQAIQAASTIFSEALPNLGQTGKVIPHHQEAFRNLMRIEAQRNALWDLLNKVRNLGEAAKIVNDERTPTGDALDTIWEMRFEVSDAFDRMGEVEHTWSQRKAFNDAIRPFARRLTIHDIPNELLTMIFNQIIGEEDDNCHLWLFPDYVADGRNPIKNVRLACRRFCDASSELLFRRVDVALNPDSLEHLDKISRDPRFSKGVRAVRIDLSCYLYNDKLAEDELAFVRGTIHSVCRWMRIDAKSLQISEKHRDCLRFRLRLRLTDSQITEAVSKVSRAVVLWRAYLASGGRSPLLDEDDIETSAEAFAAITAVRQSYREYQKRFNAQKERHYHGFFVARSVAESMARMPKAVRLLMTDNMAFVKSCRPLPCFVGTPLPELVKDWNSLVRKVMLTPSERWENSAEYRFGVPPPGHLLHMLPAALYLARVPLLDLDVNISWNRRVTWDLDDPAIYSLRALAKTLKGIDYSGPPEFPNIRSSSIHQYLSALVSGEALQKISVGFKLERAESMSIGPVLASLSPGADIRFVKLHTCSFHLDQLVSVLQRCNAIENTVVFLFGVQLLSGTWADALDALRDSVTKQGSVVYIGRPTGAECDNMSRERYNSIFVSGPTRDCKGSKANRYISDWLHDKNTHNPLRPEPVKDVPFPGEDMAGDDEPDHTGIMLSSI